MVKGIRSFKSFILGGLIVGIALISGCAGETIGGPLAAEFVYVATGTGVAQYAVNLSGQLTPLSPAEVVTTPSATTSIWVAASKDAKYAYTANGVQGNISQFSISASGTLVPLVPPTVVSGSNTKCVEITPDTKYVYSINQSASTISQFAIGTDGTLSVLSPATQSIDTGGESIAITPDGKYLYVSCSSSGFIDAFSIGINGQLTPLTVPNYVATGAIGASISPDGKYLYCPISTGVAQFSIGTDGALTPMAPATVAGTGVGNSAFTVSIDGKYGYMAVFNGGFPGSPVDQFSVGLTGALTALTPPSVAAGNAPQWIVTEPAGNYIFVANGNDGTISEFLIGANGTLTPQTPAFVTATGAVHLAVTSR